jgi:hypothetical protein
MAFDGFRNRSLADLKGATSEALHARGAPVKRLAWR